MATSGPVWLPRATPEVGSAGGRRPRRRLPPGMELSAYRIVQEALSNAMRHAPGSDVRVEVAYLPASLELRVVNGPPRARPVRSDGPGHGVLGMRERAAMLYLVLAEETIKTRVSRILFKLGLRDRTQAAVFAYETGLIRPYD